MPEIFQAVLRLEDYGQLEEVEVYSGMSPFQEFLPSPHSNPRHVKKVSVLPALEEVERYVADDQASQLRWLSAI